MRLENRKRLSEKKWNYQLQREIDMDIFKQNFTSFTSIQQRFYTKLLHQLLLLNQRQFQIKLSLTQLCPICKIHPETEIHFLHCKNCNYNVAVNELKKNIKATALQQNIDPMIQQIFRTKILINSAKRIYGDTYDVANCI